MSLSLKLGLSLSHRSGGATDKDMVLVYAITSPSTNIQLAIKAHSDWFGTGQSVSINWGDGSAAETVSATSPQSGYVGHTYTSAGTYTIRISGNMKMYGMPAGDILNGRALLTRVDSFGDLGIISFLRAFFYCAGLTSVPKTLPSSVTSMLYMFYNCSGNVFNPDVSNWDVSSVTSMYSMFGFCSGTAFRGGRGINGEGIKDWHLKTGIQSVNIADFMVSSKVQDPPFLDDILIAWAALHAQALLPTRIIAHFGSNKYTSAGEEAYTTLTTLVGSGGAGWTITSGGLQT